MQEAGLVIEAEEKRADLAALALVAEAAHHAVRGEPAFDLQHGALARAIRQVHPLGHDAVERDTPAVQPSPGFAQVAGERCEGEAVRFPDFIEELLEGLAAASESPM